MKKWILILTVLWFILVAGLSAASCSDEDGPLRAGASKVKITPAGPVYLAGFHPNRKSVGVHDDLYARCLTLRRGENRLTLVSLDLIGLLNNEVKKIVQRVEPVVGQNVIITSTHTHSGPDTIGLWGRSLLGLIPIRSGLDQVYLTFLKDLVSKAIVEAASSMEKAEVRLARSSVHGISKNIRKDKSLD